MLDCRSRCSIRLRRSTLQIQTFKALTAPTVRKSAKIQSSSNLDSWKVCQNYESLINTYQYIQLSTVAHALVMLFTAGMHLSLLFTACSPCLSRNVLWVGCLRICTWEKIYSGSHASPILFSYSLL